MKFKKKSIVAESHYKSYLEKFAELQTKYENSPNADLGISVRFYDERRIQPGLTNRILAKATDFLEVEGWDHGRFYELLVISYDLDPTIQEIYEQFRTDLLRAGLDLGITPAVDKDFIDETAVITEPFAVIKELLLRLLARAMQKKAGLNDHSAMYLQDFNDYFIYLTRTPLAVDNSIRGESASMLIQSLSNVHNRWSNILLEAVAANDAQNAIANVIENNINTLKGMEERLKMHLNTRLTASTTSLAWLRKPGSLPRYAYNEEWVPSLLSESEEKALAILNDLIPPSEATPSAPASNSLMPAPDSLVNDLQKALKQVLKEDESKFPDCKKILELYEALNYLNKIKSIVNRISQLNTNVGALIFLLNILNSENLSKHIEKCDLMVREACQLTNQEKVTFSTLSVVDFAHGTLQRVIKKSDFSYLASLHFLKEKQEELRSQFNGLYRLCQGDFEDVFLPGAKRLIAQIDSVVSSKKKKKPVKMLGDLGEPIQGQLMAPQAQPALLQVDNQNYLLRPIGSKSKKLMDALGLSHNEILQELASALANNDEVLISYLAADAILAYKSKPLPQSLCVFLTKAQFRILETVGIEEQKLCNNLRIRLSKKGVDNSVLPLNNQQFLSWFFKQGYKLDGNEQQRMKSNENEKIRILQEITLIPDFAHAYFKLRYIDDDEDFIYQKGEGCLLGSVLAQKRISLAIWGYKATGEQVEQLYQFGCKNDTLPIFINHLIETEKTFVACEIQSIALSPDNSLLKAMLKELIEPGNPLTMAQKKAILEYFCVQDKELSVDPSARLKYLEQVSQELESLEKQIGVEDKLRQSTMKAIILPLKMQIADAKQKQTTLKPPLRNFLLGSIELNLEDNFFNAFKSLQPHYTDNRILISWGNNQYQAINTGGSQNQLSLFQHGRGIYHAKGIKTSRVFVGNELAEVSCVGYEALGTTRKEFIDTLTKAISNPETKETITDCLSVEIFEYLKEKHWLFSQITTDFPLPDSIKEAFTKRSSSERKLDGILANFDARYKKGATDPLDIYQHIAQVSSTLLTKEAALYRQLIPQAVEINKQDKLIKAFCKKQDVCLAFINLHDSLHFAVKKYTIKAYARAKSLCVEIFDKSDKDALFSLSQDRKASHLIEGQRPRCILYQGFNQITLLKEQTSTENNPIALGENYLEQFTKNILDWVKDNLLVKEINLSELENEVNALVNAKAVFTGINSSMQKRVAQLNRELQEKDALLLRKNVRDRLQEALSQSREIFEFIKTSFKGDASNKPYKLAFHVNEPCDETQITLLQLAVESQQFELVQSLLKLGANPVSEYYPAFQCVIKQNAVNLSPENHLHGTYLLCNKAGTWFLTYVSEFTPGRRRTISISLEQVPGLKDALRTLEPRAEEANEQILSALTLHHQKHYFITPVLWAAHKIGFKHEQQAIFYELLDASFKLATSLYHELDEYPVHKALSHNVLVRNLAEFLVNYTHQKQEQSASRIYGFFMFWLSKMSLDHTWDRGVSVAQIFHQLITALQQKNLTPLIDCLNKKNNDRVTHLIDQSELIKQIETILHKTLEHIQMHHAAYDEEKVQIVVKTHELKAIEASGGETKLKLQIEEERARVQALELKFEEERTNRNARESQMLEMLESFKMQLSQLQPNPNQYSSSHLASQGFFGAKGHQRDEEIAIEQKAQFSLPTDEEDEYFDLVDYREDSPDSSEDTDNPYVMSISYKGR